MAALSMKFKTLIATAFATFLITPSTSCSLAAEPASLQVSCRDFAAGALIPAKFSGDGADQSPALSWSGAPSKTQSIAVICTDPDAPRGVWWHWIMFNLPAATTQLAANQAKTPSIAGGAAQGVNDFGHVGYNGPAPPKGPIHHYEFVVYALDAKLDCKPGCTKEEITAAMRGHVLAAGKYVGTYVRR